MQLCIETISFINNENESFFKMILQSLWTKEFQPLSSKCGWGKSILESL